ncbi:hypothetical protein FRB90_005264, partial [Tulasnella sp. 427]
VSSTSSHRGSVFDPPATPNDDDGASYSTPGDTYTTLSSRDLAFHAQKHGGQSIRIVPPSPRRTPLFPDDEHHTALFTEKGTSAIATTAIPPPPLSVPFSALVHPKSTTPSRQLPPPPSDAPASQEELAPDGVVDISPARLAELRRASGVTTVLKIYDGSGQIASTQFDDNSIKTDKNSLLSEKSDVRHRPSPNNVAVVKVDQTDFLDREKSNSPSSPNRRRFTNPERLLLSPLPPSSSPIAGRSATPTPPRGQPFQGRTTVTPGFTIGLDATHTASPDVSVLSSSTSATSVLNSSSERDIATSKVSTATRVNVNVIRAQQHARRMSKDLVNLPDATTTTTPTAQGTDIGQGEDEEAVLLAQQDHHHHRGGGPLKPNPLKKIMSISTLHHEIENENESRDRERRRKGGSLPSTPTWSPPLESSPFPKIQAQVIPPSPTPSLPHGESAIPMAPSHSASRLSTTSSSSIHPALTPPPKHRKSQPASSKLKRPKTADDASALSPPPWRSTASSFSGSSAKRDGLAGPVANVKDMGGGVSVVRIPVAVAPRMRRPATSPGIVSPKEGSFSRAHGEEVDEALSQRGQSPSIPESEASFYSSAIRQAQDSTPGHPSTPSLLGKNARDSVQMLVKRRSVRLTVPGEDEHAPLRRKHSSGRSFVVRKTISDGSFRARTPEVPEERLGDDVRRYGSLRKVGTVPLKKSIEEAADRKGKHRDRPTSPRKARRKVKRRDRATLAYVLATAEPEPFASISPGQPSYLSGGGGGLLNRVRSFSSLSDAFDDEEHGEREDGKDFSDSRSTFGKYGSDGEDEVVHRAGDLSAELSEGTRAMMSNMREQKGRKMRNDVN